MAPTSTTATAPSRVAKRTAPDDTSSMLAALPCRRCRSRKVKCDGIFPTCNGCLKADVSCVIADSTATRDYTRAEVHKLEEKARELEALLQIDAHPASSRSAISDTSQNEANQNQYLRHLSDVTTHYVGEESGVSFMRRIITSIRPHGSDTSHPPLTAPRSLDAVPAYYCPPQKLPAQDETILVVKEYLRKFHITHPFLERSKIWSIIDHVYGVMDRPDNDSSMDRSYRQDLFQLNMILAIGSVELYRQGQSSNEPFGYFTAALKIIAPLGFSFGSMEDVTNFLLIARFGLLYYIGCSVWELSQICLRTCIELKLHRRNEKPSSSSNIHEQTRRRIFWDCYELDRYSSAMLGRPFGIDEEDIDVGYPFDVDDISLEGTSAQSDDQANESEPNSSMSVFIHFLRLSRITSRMHHSMSFQHTSKASPFGSNRTIPPIGLLDISQMGEIFSLLKNFHDELANWRATAPYFDEPECVYQTQDWFELAYQRERLALLRAAMAWIPSRGHFPPKDILNSCVGAAFAVIRSYNEMRCKGLITYTRGFTLMIFSSGMVVMFAAFMHVRPHEKQGSGEDSDMFGVSLSSWWHSLLDDTTHQVSLKECLEVLEEASKILSWMAEAMNDMKSYAKFFGALLKELQSTCIKGPRDTRNHGQSRNQSPPIQTMSSVEYGWVGALTHTRGSHGGNQSHDATIDHLHNEPAAATASILPYMDLTADAFFEPGFSDDQFHPFQLSSWPFTEMPLGEGMVFGLDDNQWNPDYVSDFNYT